MEIEKDELLAMLKAFWSVNNNDVCSAFTKRFMEHNNFSDNEINYIVELEDEEEYNKLTEESYLIQIKDYYI